MTVRDFALLTAICMVWGLNIIISRWVFTSSDVEPLFYAGMRFALIALVLTPLFFRDRPKELLMVFLISLCMGSGHFGLLFVGLANATASSAAVVGQLGVPFSTILSMVFLSERIGWRRGIGITMAFLGAVVISVDPGSFTLSTGLLFVIASAFIGSCGAILMKQITPISGVRLQAWVGLFSFMPLLLVSAVLEGEGSFGLGDQFTAFLDAGLWVWVATAFAVIAVSIFGHGSFYRLLTRYDVTLLSPLTLMVPVWGVVFGIVLLNEPFTWQLVIGGAISLFGVLIIALRPNTRFPLAAIGKKLVSGS